ncbi:DUF2163 domain-containing protein [Roseibaca sp. Y0-43]|uniref:DUF2163 domain-containing protein n=1 Tax=Roseibaca sp. Y0-43 TaxID=2816854 RepID=UPI001D0C1E3B|nr:DUF2163 domain-containing protein [Roseibaca sp. Y0-43]MCC1481446.1 DUF2163 domain-containing protein [Roseibaca sp. Y0-43]
MTLAEHLATGTTTVARAWALVRADGQTLGFTDHDRDMRFQGITFRAEAGLTARALEQVTGLAVDNSEAVGALRDAGLTEADILAGRYDGAELTIWEVNWQDVAERRVLFRGSLGEITRSGAAFRAELRGLSEALGQQGGRVYHASCSAVLGDGACRFDTGQTGFSAEVALAGMAEDVLLFDGLDSFTPGWFTHGRITALSGAAEGLVALIRLDRAQGARRQITLWDSLRAPVATGDLFRLEAGCDKQAATCRNKFANFLNFRGFPHIPGEDWLTAYPKAGAANTGGPWRR